MSEPVRTQPPHISVSSASTRANRTGSWKYIRPRYRDAVAPCNARCPAGGDIEGWMNLLREGRTADALDLLLRENPLPAITGRVCHHPCELACNRAHFDDPVAIHLVERDLGDRILAEAPPIFARTREERVAVIGSGPAGLACAWHLARLGYPVTVFEAAAEAGGMLRQGIPEYRLPRAVLDRQIEWLRGTGIDIRCGARIAIHGADDLAGFDAVFVATGAHRPRPVGAAGEEGPRVMAGLDFLKAVNRGEPPEIGHRVIVVGGGNTAIDCARTALRLGASPIVLYRRTRDEMPAIAAEVDEAMREGIPFEFLAAPRSFHHIHGRLTGIECERMVLGEPDASGRRRPIPSGNGTFSILADTVLSAIGEDAELEALPGAVLDADGRIVIDELGATRAAGFWAGGDLAGGERTVADALGSGKVAAIGIDRALRVKRGEAVPARDVAELRWSGGGMSMSRWRADDPIRRTEPVNEVVQPEALNTAHYTHIARHRETFGDTIDFSEVNRGLTPQEALEEARRCLNCGVCNQCELCLIMCPDVAITRQEEGGYAIDLDYCKGCGICALECPRGAIVMTREGL